MSQYIISVLNIIKAVILLILLFCDLEGLNCKLKEYRLDRSYRGIYVLGRINPAFGSQPRMALATRLEIIMGAIMMQRKQHRPARNPRRSFL